MEQAGQLDSARVASCSGFLHAVDTVLCHGIKAFEMTVCTAVNRFTNFANKISIFLSPFYIVFETPSMDALGRYQNIKEIVQ